MNKICCFAGHSQIYGENDLHDKLLTKIEELITKENVTEFWVGDYGAFDRAAAKAVRICKKTYPHIQLHLIIPYPTQKLNLFKEQYQKEYDSIIQADMPENTPTKFRISQCNRYMVKNAQYLICYIQHGWGGAAQTLAYAQNQKHIQIFNLAK